jgi:hypothetical protein
MVNAVMTRSLLTGDRAPAPPQLIAAYPDVLAPFAVASE